tara:strand:- start:92 stop:733 length:642 start_codon:yes stop_codon:yes gene_type:complete
MTFQQESKFSGVYGFYTITQQDKHEVKLYRLSLLLSSLAFFVGLTQWIFIGPSMVWISLMVMALGIGASLNWIHIYLRSLHNILKIFWLAGCLGLTIALWNFGSSNLMITFTQNPMWIIAIGPFFAALTGLGFKEFFCFRRPEAIGLTLLVPIALFGHLTQLMNGQIVISILLVSSVFFLVLALRKFGMEAASDIGDKSIFEYLDNQRNSKVV